MIEKKKCRWIHFFRLEQFLYNNKLNLNLIRQILKNYELHFVKQQLSFYKLSDLKISFDNLLIYEDLKSS